MAGSCFSLLPLFGIFILRWLLRKNRDACHVPPKTSSEFYQTFVCVIHPTAKCCCSGNLHKRTSLWLFLQILLYYNFRWHNISESRILDFINYLWYILPRPAVADGTCFPLINLLLIWMNLQGEAYQKIIIFNHKESDTPPQGPENSCIFDVFFWSWTKLPQGHVDKQYMHWLGVSLAIPRVVKFARRSWLLMPFLNIFVCKS